MPSWAVPVPDSIADAAGEGREALRALRAECRETEAELQRVLKASGNLDPNLMRRAADLKGMVDKYERQLHEAHRSLADVGSETYRGARAAVRLVESLRSGHVSGYTMREVGSVFRAGGAVAEAVGAVGVAGALGTVASAVSGPAGMVAGAVVGAVVQQLEAQDARYRRGLAVSDRISAVTRNVIGDFGGQGEIGSKWTEAARAAAKEAGKVYLRYRTIGEQTSEGIVVGTKKELIEESKEEAAKAEAAYMVHFRKVMADSQSPLWQAAFALAGGQEGQMNLVAAGFAGDAVAEYRRVQSKQNQYFADNPKAASKRQEEQSAAKAAERFHATRMQTTLQTD